VAIFHDHVTAAEMISQQRFDGLGHRSPSLTHSDHRQRVILFQVVDTVGYIEMVPGAPHVRPNGGPGIDSLQGSLKNLLQIVPQLRSLLHYFILLYRSPSCPLVTVD
jgi:hypothetical protein